MFLDGLYKAKVATERQADLIPGFPLKGTLCLHIFSLSDTTHFNFSLKSIMIKF